MPIVSTAEVHICTKIISCISIFTDLFQTDLWIKFTQVRGLCGSPPGQRTVSQGQQLLPTVCDWFQLLQVIRIYKYNTLSLDGSFSLKNNMKYTISGIIWKVYQSFIITIVSLCNCKDSIFKSSKLKGLFFLKTFNTPYF